MLQKVKNFYHLFIAILANLIYRFPAKNLYVIGVTGTDGKTTTVHLIYEILKTAGKKVGLISTIVAKIGEEEIGTGFHVTTPSSFALQSLLRKMVDSGIKYVVLEATSHGLDQRRLFGCHFKIGIITNVTHEHLDYHHTWDNYLQAKAKLFNRVEWGVLNSDDESFEKLREILKKKQVKHVTYGLRGPADLVAQEIQFSSEGLEFKIENQINKSRFQIKTALLGEYNLSNCLAAISAAQILAIQRKDIQKALKKFHSVPGRLQTIDEDQKFKVIIDFAHTPNALKQTLKTLKFPKKKLIVVFGCAGLRDKQKRPMMGEIAAKLADLIILTSEDPRTEDVNQIIEEIARGCQDLGVREANINFNLESLSQSEPWFFRLPDRQKAIEFALEKLAQRGDIVVICGKGHEQSMCFGKREFPWSDEEVTREILRK